MKRLGIVSYNMYGNFTNYGSALQSYALKEALNRQDGVEAVVVDYCPDVLRDKDILDPVKNMWDTDAEVRENCRKSLPAIHENYLKFSRFYKNHYPLTSQKYTSDNFDEIGSVDGIERFVCGSDTVFAVPEFGFDPGYYADYEVMKGRSVAYAASFGDYDVPVDDLPALKARLSNFKAIALRERDKQLLVKSLVTSPVYKVIDPTLLLEAADYEPLASPAPYDFPYLLLYSRRNDPRMTDFAIRYAATHRLKVVEISLNATNRERGHIMRYDAGVEEFLGLVKGARMVVTNSFHGMIFAVQFHRPFYIFSRKLCDTKILELLEMMKLTHRMVTTQLPEKDETIDYDLVHAQIARARNESLDVLRDMIETL